MEPSVPRPTGGFATRAVTGAVTLPDVRQHPSSAGAVVGDADLIARIRRHTYELGRSLGAFDAWLILRGLQTLALRVREASGNALRVAQALDADPRAAAVRYPGLATHGQHELAGQLFGGRGYGARLSFDLPTRGGAEAFADACEVFVRASSLGGTHSLVLHPASTSHRQLDVAALQAAGLNAGTVRLSMGIEDVDDLVADVHRGLAAADAAQEGAV